MGITELERHDAGLIEPKRKIEGDDELRARALEEKRRRLYERALYLSRRNAVDPVTGRTARPRTMPEFREWIEKCLGYNFTLGELRFNDEPLTTGAEFEHTVPLRWCYDLYCLASGRSNDGLWRRLTKKELSRAVKTFVMHGPRSGAKTLGIAIFLWTMAWWEDGWTWTHAAAERGQAYKVLEYMRSNWAKSSLFSEGVDKVNSQIVMFTHNSYVQIVTGSMGGLNSPHTIGISFDEVELMDPAVIDQGLMVPQAQAGRPFPSLVIFASTLKKANKTMIVKIDEAKRGKHVYILWDLWDVIERCEDWRREDLPEDLNCTDYVSITEEINELEERELALKIHDRLRLDDLRESIITLRENCNLIEDCKGKAIRSAGHWSIDVARSDYDTIPRHTIRAELLCQKPSTAGAVYELYDAEAGNETMEAVWRKPDPPKVRIIGAADYGFATDPAAANLFCVHGPYMDAFYEVHEHGWLSDKQADHYVKLTKMFGVAYWVVDKTAKELIARMKKRGLLVVLSSGKVSPGIEDLAARVCNGASFRSFRVNPVACPFLCSEMATYVKGKDGEPLENQPDHHCDLSRYLARHLRQNRNVLKQGVQRGVHPTGRTSGGRIIQYYASQLSANRRVRKAP